MRVEDIGSWIRQERKNKGISLDKLSYECGLDKSAFSYAERGRNFLKLGNLQNVLDVLGYEIEFVKKGDNNG